MSKRLALALRHRPDRFGLTLDAQGWAPVTDVARGLGVTVADVEAAVALPGKKRYELDAGRIRARYGHSVESEVERPVAAPPPVLYHGTSAATVPAILREGLRPMRRQHVHLSADVETARIVGARRRGPVAVLRVDTAAAVAAGVVFRTADDGVWLADPVPPAYLAVDG